MTSLESVKNCNLLFVKRKPPTIMGWSKWLTPGYYLSEKIPLWWKQLNHTNQSSSIMKLGCVQPMYNVYMLLSLETVFGLELTESDDQRFTGLHLMELNIFVLLICCFGFCQDGQDVYTGSCMDSRSIL